MTPEIEDEVDSMNLAEFVEQLGGVALERIRMRPWPGTATEADLIQIQRRSGRRYELVDGTLVEKPMGSRESLLAGIFIYLLWTYLEEHDVGQALTADGALRLMPGLVRVPDVSFIRWEQMPDGELPPQPIPDLYPDLAVEVLSESNRPGEISRKVRDYFLSGTRLVWVIRPSDQSADVYTAPDQMCTLRGEECLDGGDLLPGFRLSLKDFFGRRRRRR